MNAITNLAYNSSVGNLTVLNTLTANNVTDTITIQGLSSNVSNTISVLCAYITAGYGYVWTTSRTDNTVSVINPITMTVDNTLQVGVGLLNFITYGYGYIWVSNYTTNKSVEVIDPSTMTVTASIILGAIGGQCITSGYGYIWVTLFGAGQNTTVAVINPNTMNVVNTVTVGSGPYGITDGFGYIWVCNTSSSTISVINPTTMLVTQTIAIGNSSTPLGIVSGYGYIWVTNDTTFTISVIDPNTMSIIETISIGKRAECISLGYGYIWVACSDILAVVIDPITLTIVESIGPGSFLGRGIASGYGYIWVTSSSAISVIKGQGILNSYDVTTDTLEVDNSSTFNGDMEIVNSSLSITGSGSLTVGGTLNAKTINTQIFNLGTGTTQNVNCFSSRWNNYNCTLCLNAGQVDVKVHLGNTVNGVATPTITDWNYNFSNIFGQLGGTTATIQAGRDNDYPLYIGGTSNYDQLNDVFEFTIYNPMVNKSTGIKSNNQYYQSNDGGNYIVNGYLDNGSSETFNTLFLYFSGTIDAGGTVSVRGFN